MERPSHIAFQKSQPVSRRIISLGLALSFPTVVLWGLTSGVGTQVIKIIEPLVLLKQDDPVKPDALPPPLDPVFKEVKPLVVPKPDFVYDQGGIPADRGITAHAGAGTVTTPPEPPAAGPDRAAVSIASTHTTPPYPILARRIGAEGKVTLRLTVLTDGMVGMAEIVTSSGRSDLDEAARDWVVRHWTYKPALDKGRPVISHVVAGVVFQLNGR